MNNNPIDMKLMKSLTEAHGPAGCEDEVRNIIKAKLGGIVDSFEYDNLGSIIARLNNHHQGPKIAVVAHMDEVGFLVKEITFEGFIKLHLMGGVDPLVAVNSEVEIKTRSQKKLKGVTFTDKPLNNLSFDEIYVDVGCHSQQDVKSLGLRIGDSVVFSRSTFNLNDTGNLVAKSWDDRIGCLLGIELMKRLKDQSLKSDVYFVGSVQEEIGTRGAKTAIELLKPDIVVVIDVATTKRTPSCPSNCRIYGQGPCIVVADKLALGNRVLMNYFTDMAEEFAIPYQLDFLAGGGTDNGPATISGSGTAGLAVIIPVKNCHTPHTIVSMSDYQQTLELLEKSIASMDHQIIQQIYHYKY